MSEEKEYKYPLPRGDDKDEKTTQKNSVIIIGGNGAGKSHLGAWIEEVLGKKCHRIGGQRNLSFENRELVIRPLDLAQNKLEFNEVNVESNPQYYIENKLQKWRNNKTTTLLNDFGDALSAFLSLESFENQSMVENARQLEDLECGVMVKNHLSLKDKLQIIWNKIFPQRSIFVEKFQFFAQKSDGEKYSATEMSDGERGVLYLIAQVLSVREGKTIIIDEPEIHLHPSIMNRLWLALEEYRKDCLFIYITHDIEFASLHGESDKIWVKSFDIENGVKTWDYEELEYQDNFPEDLLLEILGGRKNVLFVEGEKQSFDTQLYQKLYPEFFVIPCGGCEKVIEWTKSLNAIKVFNNAYKAYGIIDRDFRTEHELECLKQNNIFALNVAEVENLFLLEDVVSFFIKKDMYNEDHDELLTKVKNFIVDTKFKNQKHRQIQKAINSELQYELKKFSLDEKMNDVDDIKESVTFYVNGIDYKKIIQEITKKFETNDYCEILSVFNKKDLILDIDEMFGFQKKYQYVNKILHSLSKNKELREIFLKHMPDSLKNHSVTTASSTPPTPPH